MDETTYGRHNCSPQERGPGVIHAKVVALTPRDFRSKEEAEGRIRRFLALRNRRPRPFRWGYTRKDLSEDLKRWEEEEKNGEPPPPGRGKGWRKDEGRSRRTSRDC